jgi:RimJ/RimL family protein N-acetyltransferase
MPQTIESIRFERQGGFLDCFLVPWDSRIFGQPVAQIEGFEFANETESRGLLEDLDTWCTNHGVRFVSCRLDHLNLRGSMALEERGFRFVEIVYRPRLDLISSAIPEHSAIVVSEAGDADRSKIERIASSAFTTGRFLLDWRLPGALSQRRYASWVRSSLQASGQTVLKAEHDGEIFGFFIVERRPDRSMYWHLTAIDQRWQGKGLGLGLWQTMLRRHEAEAASYVETTISAHNLRAMNLYARLGFSFASAQMTFHRLVGPSE